MKQRRRRFKTARPDRRLGPADCFKTRFSGKCSKCAGTATNHFQEPYGIFVDASGRIFVTDNLNCRVVSFDNMAGKNWTSFGTCGSGNLQFNNPTGLVVDSSGRIYITDTGNNRVVRVSAPVAISLDGAGNLCPRLVFCPRVSHR